MYEDKKLVFEGIVNENEVQKLREYLNSNAPDTLEFNFETCKDMHTAVLQVVLAYKHLYNAEYKFPSDETLAYRDTLEGFFLSDDNTN
jgi:hypothetical protein